MHLEDVIINGFESYAIETVISFNPEIGVVIGNTGTGKSNILDTIVWG